MRAAHHLNADTASSTTTATATAHFIGREERRGLVKAGRRGHFQRMETGALSKGFDGVNSARLVMPGPDPGIQGCRPPLDCRIKSGNDNDRADKVSRA